MKAAVIIKLVVDENEKLHFNGLSELSVHISACQVNRIYKTLFREDGTWRNDAGFTDTKGW